MAKKKTKIVEDKAEIAEISEVVKDDPASEIRESQEDVPEPKITNGQEFVKELKVETVELTDEQAKAMKQRAYEALANLPSYDDDDGCQVCGS